MIIVVNTKTFQYYFVVKKSRVIEKDIDLLRDTFYVDESSPSGIRWKKNAQTRSYLRAGIPAGFKHSNGSWNVEVKNNIKLKTSRIVWILTNGEIPKDQVVDHENGNPSDNRIDNLQLLDEPANNRARNRLSKANTTGFVGVYWHKPARKWMATIHRLKRVHLGYFDKAIDGAKAYNQFSIQWAKEHGETPRYLNPV